MALSYSRRLDQLHRLNGELAEAPDKPVFTDGYVLSGRLMRSWIITSSRLPISKRTCRRARGGARPAGPSAKALVRLDVVDECLPILAVPASAKRWLRPNAATR